jgi:hypothetical protein
VNRVYEDRIQGEALAAAEAGLTGAEARATLRRQFIGSVAAAVAVMAAVGLTAMRPAHETAGSEATHRISVVQQPTFVAPHDRLIASRQH